MADGEVTEPSKEENQYRRRLIALEVLVLSGTHLSTILTPLLGVPMSASSSYVNPQATIFIVSDLSRLALYLFVMYASGDPLSGFGLKRIEWKRDLSCFCLAGVVLSAIYAHYFITHAGLKLPPLPPSIVQRLISIPYLVFLCLVIGAVEEVGYRGYLISRLEELTGKTWLAVIVQAVFFGLVHLYEGSFGVITAGLVGLAFGFLYSKYRSVWPLALAHAALDFTVFYRLLHVFR